MAQDPGGDLFEDGLNVMLAEIDLQLARNNQLRGSLYALQEQQEFKLMTVNENINKLRIQEREDVFKSFELKQKLEATKSEINALDKDMDEKLKIMYVEKGKEKKEARMELAKQEEKEKNINCALSEKDKENKNLESGISQLERQVEDIAKEEQKVEVLIAAQRSKVKTQFLHISNELAQAHVELNPSGCFTYRNYKSAAEAINADRPVYAHVSLIEVADRRHNWKRGLRNAKKAAEQAGSEKEKRCTKQTKK